MKLIGTMTEEAEQHYYVYVAVKRDIKDGTPMHHLMSDENGEPFPVFRSLEDCQGFLRSIEAPRCGIMQLEVVH